MAPESPPVGTTVVATRPGRLDALVHAACPRLSRRRIRRLIDDGVVRVDGRRVSRGARVASGERVTLPRVDLEPRPDLEVRIVHVDERLVVVDKPGGMPGHALDPRQRDSVAAFLAGRFPETAGIGDPLSSGLVHRLDIGTSGVQIAARTPEVHACLRAAFRAGEVTKRYLAVVAGLPPSCMTIETPLAHHPRDRRRMAPARPGDRAWPARTEVVRLATASDHTLVEVTLRSGVTHQARAHLALRGHPIVGDHLYGGSPGMLAPHRHALHAASIVGTGRVDLPRLESPLPPDLRALVGEE